MAVLRQIGRFAQAVVAGRGDDGHSEIEGTARSAGDAELCRNVVAQVLLEDAAAHPGEGDASLVHFVGTEQGDVVGQGLLAAVQCVAAEAGDVVGAGAERIEGVEPILLAVAVAAEEGVPVVEVMIHAHRELVEIVGLGGA